MRTTYDPCRNQIVRNIDCLLDFAAGREVGFWMFVKDTSPTRAYAQLIEGYQRDPGLLARELPHRNSEAFASLARNLTMVTWRDLIGSLCEPQANDHALMGSVKEEVWSRIS